MTRVAHRSSWIVGIVFLLLSVTVTAGSEPSVRSTLGIEPSAALPVAVPVESISNSLVQSTQPSRVLSFEERVECQRRIEEVRWRYTTWPEANPTPKPALSEVLSEEAIRSKVEEALRKSSALAEQWQRPITAAQLQAEMERMARGTRHAELLLALFATLDDDPFVIAECLARPVLSDRLLRNWYAYDSRFHGEVGAVAESAMAGGVTASELPVVAEKYEEVLFEDAGLEEVDLSYGERDALRLDSEEWSEELRRLAGRFGVGRTAGPQAREFGAAVTGTADDAYDEIEALLAEIPLGEVSALEETVDGWRAVTALSKAEGSIRLGIARWPKLPFSMWWASVRDDLEPAEEPLPGGYTLATVTADGGCTPDTWRILEHELPSGRYDHTAVWTGARMIVWGGSPYTTTGGVYDPGTDSWTPTSVEGAPSTRVSHTAVWTGARMIVWGGWDSDSSARTNTGGMYDPGTDSWVDTPVEGAPSGRYDHTAVWTGDRMIVWGGLGIHGLETNTGGVYDPGTVSWTATEIEGAPSVRSAHTAVWVGTRMIVFGGGWEDHAGEFPIFNPTNTGGMYDPGTDSWVDTSVEGAPWARSGHTAVWTGDHMIVWGGISLQNRRSLQFTNTGGVYDSATDSWTATSVEGAPSRRHGHTAVWTGERMIVWGGFGYLTNIGSMYDPGTDSWTPTSVEGAPSARSRHTAVYTGSEMLVWGGVPQSIELGAYCGPEVNPVVNVPGDVETIQGGIDAVDPGGLVIVEPGVYNETIDFGGKKLTLRSTVPDDPTVVSNTVIDGTGLGDSVVRCVSGEGTDTVLAGFTVTGGYAFEGGGMRIVDSSPIVRDCVFTGNTASDGGGMYNLRSSPTVSGCTFADNIVSTDGGGMHNEDSNPFLLSCTFRRNNALSGAGMYNEGSFPAVVDSIFIENTAMRIFDLFAAGGGMCNVRSNPTVVNGLFIGNVAQGGGFGGGGAMYNFDSSPKVINSTLSGNSGEFGDAGGIYSRGNSHLVVNNSILWGNYPPEIDNAFGAVDTVRYSDVEGGWLGAGNIALDPMFVDPDGPDGDPNTFGDNDYRLSGGSPCIDAADNTVVPGVIVADLDGNPRFVDDPDTPDTGIGDPPVVDMGAYENAAAPGPGEVTGLMVDEGPDPSRLTLTWELSCNPGTDYGVYEGTLLSLRVGVYDHGPLVCSDASPFLEETIVTALSDTYYLVVPLDASAEGSHGQRRIDGVTSERPVGVTQCVATQILGCP